MTGDLKERPVIQRTKDREYFRINNACYRWVNGHAERIEDIEFRESTRGKEFETLDLELGSKQ